MKVHVISETSFIVKGTGVHTAFLNHLSLLKEKNDIEVVVNGEGTGDVFHSHTYFIYYFWKGRKYKGRRVFTAHVIPDSIIGSLPVWRLFMPFVRWGLKKVYSYADICIAISPTVEDAIIKTGAKTKIVSIYNPINVDIWKRTEEKRLKGRHLLELSDSDFVVIGVGQLMGGKGVEDFLEIAEKINEARFVWVGGRPFGVLTEGKRRINGRFKKSGDRVITTGQLGLEQMPFVYAAADLMLFPSYKENCPLAPLEAAACGMPVIYRDLEEYRLLYKNPYLKAGDKNEFISLTKRMIHDKDFYNEGLKISEKLLRQFDKNNIREKLINLYESLINN
jgi:1,2-diacylglycerol-3-alpha-glucose alpha-1,2-galactosyltransferase